MVRRRSAVNVIIAASKDFNRLPESGFPRTRRGAVRRLGGRRGPFVILMGSRVPCGSTTLGATRRVRRGCGMATLAMGYSRLEGRSVTEVLRGILCRFPIDRVRFFVPH